MNEYEKFIEKLEQRSIDELDGIRKYTALINNILNIVGISILFITLNFPIIAIISILGVYILANISVYMVHIVELIDEEINRRINT